MEKTIALPQLRRHITITATIPTAQRPTRGFDVCPPSPQWTFGRCSSSVSQYDEESAIESCRSRQIFLTIVSPCGWCLPLRIPGRSRIPDRNLKKLRNPKTHLHIPTDGTLNPFSLPLPPLWLVPRLAYRANKTSDFHIFVLNDRHQPKPKIPVLSLFCNSPALPFFIIKFASILKLRPPDLTSNSRLKAYPYQMSASIFERNISKQEYAPKYAITSL